MRSRRLGPYLATGENCREETGHMARPHGHLATHFRWMDWAIWADLKEMGAVVLIPRPCVAARGRMAHT